MDENSILSVSAVEKGTGKSESITVTNDKGRLSKEEIENMIRDAEKFADSDKALKEKIDSKNSLENYVYTMRNTIEDKEKLADKIEDEDKEKIKEALQEAQDWIKEHEDAEKEEIDAQMKELQSICDPIIAKVYKQHGQQQEGGSEEEDHEDL